MRFISVFLILIVVQISFCAVYEPNAEINTSDGVEGDYGYERTMKDKLQSDPEEDEDEDMDNGDADVLQNQDDDQEPNGETTQPSPPIAPQPNNVDQNRGLPGVSVTENMSPPDYSSVNMRGLAVILVLS